MHGPLVMMRVKDKGNVYVRRARILLLLMEADYDPDEPSSEDVELFVRFDCP